jgi:hypothetical protein
LGGLVESGQVSVEERDNLFERDFGLGDQFRGGLGVVVAA